MILLRGSRSYDLTLGLFFAAFVAVCALVEAPYCAGFPVSADSPIASLRASYDWCKTADVLFLVRPLWVQVATCFHAFFFGPMYFLFAVCLVLRIQAIRIPALVVCGMKLYAGALYMAGNLGDAQFAPVKPWLFVLQSSSYMMIPFLMMVRMARPNPFGAAAKHQSAVADKKRK
eukprot:ANDGO_04339.mRNA.1 hypothetical protein AURANDRAFT_64232